MRVWIFSRRLDHYPTEEYREWFSRRALTLVSMSEYSLPVNSPAPSDRIARVVRATFFAALSIYMDNKEVIMEALAAKIPYQVAEKDLRLVTTMIK
jgi:hypothetical protein